MNILILIAEDDNYNNKALCEVLESEGYNVETALNSLDAINKVKHNEKTYQLLILDYNLQDLQGTTGLDIFEMAKENDPNIQAIMISSYGEDKGLKEKVHNSIGIRAFVDKPFLTTDLIDTVDDILRQEETASN